MSHKEFYRDDYRLKVEYLSAHFSRMWTRFNFFLAIQSVLFSLSFHDDYSSSSGIFPAVGVILCFVWYFFGAADNYLADQYREHVKRSHERLVQDLRDSGQELEATACGDEYPGKGCSYAGDVNAAFAPSPSPFRFRVKGLSVTEMAVVLPVIFAIGWVARPCFP